MISAGILFAGHVYAQQSPPEAPAWWSWLPHGYGASILLEQPFWGPPAELHGFRVSPAYAGCIRLQVWGWDVNSFHAPPPVNAAEHPPSQLPLGLSYHGAYPRP